MNFVFVFPGQLGRLLSDTSITLEIVAKNRTCILGELSIGHISKSLQMTNEQLANIQVPFLAAISNLL